MERRTGDILSIDAYIAAFPEERRVLLEEVRATIKAAAPDAQECISYGMPAFSLGGILVYFACLKNHIGFYPTGSGIEAFQDALSVYECTKGSVKFPVSQPLPLDLIGEIVRFRVADNLKRAKARAEQKRAATSAAKTARRAVTERP